MVLQKMVQHLQSSFQYDNDKIITEATSTSVQGKYNQTWSKKRLLKVIHSCHRTLSQSRSSERKKKEKKPLRRHDLGAKIRELPGLCT